MALWFASGAVLHFVPFPSLSESERLEKGARINLSRVQVTPAAVLGLAPGANRLRLVDVTGRPVYILQPFDGHVLAVAADTGQPLPVLSGNDAREIAMAFQGANATRVEGPLIYDQWTVAQEFNPFRPFFRVSFSDAARTALYVSARTGEVMQRTTAPERFWNWCGANIHWIYFSALRVRWSTWDRVVWWVSLVALSTTVAGVCLGWVRFANARCLRGRRLTPFRGWLGWHHRIGLFGGTFVLVWIFSGWLSMDHGRLFPTGRPTSEQVSRLQGRSLESIADALTIPAIRASGDASEIIAGAIAGRAFLAARGVGGPTRVWWLDAPAAEPTERIPDSWLVAGVRAAWPDRPVEDRGVIAAGDLYSMAEGMPVATRAIHVGGSQPVDVYVDQVSGRIVTAMDSNRRAYAWLYYALHTFKFPALAGEPKLRHLAILGPLALGFVFSVTGVIVAVTRLRLTLGGTRV